MTKYARFIPQKSESVKRLADLVQNNYSFSVLEPDLLNQRKVAVEYYQPSSEPSRMTDEDYLRMRKMILELATECQSTNSFDSTVLATEKQAIQFDRGISVQGHLIFPLGLYEASRDEVWNYITLYVAPDVANWRYPNIEKSPSYDRHLGGYRNTFRQPWMRGFFCNWDNDLISELTEDIAVAIFERTNLASNPRVAIACLRATYRIREKDKNNKIYRDALKRVVRLMSVRSMDQLPDDQLQLQIDRLFDQSYSVFSKANTKSY